MDELIERSSLGTDAAAARRASVPEETAAEVLRRAAPHQPLFYLTYGTREERRVSRVLRDVLESRFGPRSAVQSMDGRRLPAELRDAMRDALVRCQALLAVISPSWTGTDHRSRLPVRAADTARADIAAAVENGVQVVPVLIHRASLLVPRDRDLPVDLAAVASQPPYRLRRGHMRFDLRRMLDGLADLLPQEDAAAGLAAGSVDSGLVSDVRRAIAYSPLRRCRDTTFASVDRMLTLVARSDDQGWLEPVRTRLTSRRDRDRDTVAFH